MFYFVNQVKGHKLVLGWKSYARHVAWILFVGFLLLLFIGMEFLVVCMAIECGLENNFPFVANRTPTSCLKPLKAAKA